MYNEDEYLLISGIQHFVFCRRQWALIHIEQQWNENFLTADGRILHENVHNGSYREKRGEFITVRALQVSSRRLGISGECDLVEFRQEPKGISLFGVSGKYSVTPVEYKRGKPKEKESDILQLAAQAICLEEMLCTEIPAGYLYYGEIRHRVKVDFDASLRQRLEEVILEMHRLFREKRTPMVRRTAACNACSLRNICLPVICGKSASEYVRTMLREDMDREEIT